MRFLVFRGRIVGVLLGSCFCQCSWARVFFFFAVGGGVVWSVSFVSCFLLGISGGGVGWLPPAHRTAAEIERQEEENRERRVRSALLEESRETDYMLIDGPPSLNLLPLHGLVAADGVIIAMQGEYFALEGLTALISTIQRVAESVNPELQIEGILRTMYDPRNSLTNEVSNQLHDHFGDKVYRTVVPRNVRLAEAPSHGLPAMYFDKYSRGSKAYMALAGEIIRREEKLVAAGQGDNSVPVVEESGVQ